MATAGRTGVVCGVFLTLLSCITLTHSCPDYWYELTLSYRGLLGSDTYPDLESIRKNIHDTVCSLMYTPGVALDLSLNNLTAVPYSVLAGTTCPYSVVSLNVSHNALSKLESDVSGNVDCLRELDVSFNNITRITEGSLPRQLTLLNISHNGLISIEKGSFHGMTSLVTLVASHNALTEVKTEVFEKGMERVKLADFSFNRITAFEPWPYYFNDIFHVDLRHNNISHFTNSANVSLINGREMLQAKVDLRFNQLSRIEQREASAYFEGRMPNAMEMGNLALEITENPWVCDCGIYWLVDVIRHSLVQEYVDVYNYFVCQSPPHLSGKPLGYLLKNPQEVVCNVTENCPLGCTCQDQPLNGYIRVDCDPATHLYSQLPPVVPAHKPVYLNLSGHALHRLDQVPVYNDRLYGLDVSHNKLAYLSSSFLESATSLVLFNVSDNQLTTLPQNIRGLSLENTRLSGNSLKCSCDFIWFGDWVSATYSATNTTTTTTTSPSDAASQNHDLGPSFLDMLQGQHASDSSQLALSDSSSSSSSSPTSLSAEDRRRLDALHCVTEDGEKLHVTEMSMSSLGCRHLTITLLVIAGSFLLAIVCTVLVSWRWRYQVTVILNYWFGDFRRRHRCCYCRPKDTVPRMEEGSFHAVPGATHPRDAFIAYDLYKTHRYDVYISMDEDDEAAVEWAQKVLLPLLEGRRLRVYWPLRDELAGVCKSEARVEAIFRSHSVLVLISSNYAQNTWCRFEFDHACKYLEQDQKAGNLVLLIIARDNDNNVIREDGNITRGEHDQKPETEVTALSHFRENNGHLESVEPLKTYLADRKYLALSDSLLKQKLVFEVTCKRKKEKEKPEQDQRA